ncbi:MAG: DUF4293 domain-containing protein [Chitinophagales bacterium]|nr:DUF4293 domain-containing protein [Chitinophagales bacterium]
MIQRIQTIYLFLAAIFLFVLLFLSIGVRENESVKMFENLYTTVLSIVSGGTAIIAIFLFNNRKLQIKIISGLTVLCLGVIASLVIFQFVLPTQLTTINYIPYASPIIAFIFSILALKGVKADEKLVRSMDRLR